MDESDEIRRLLLKDALELEAKTLNYLLVGNGAGLAGCLATLKDYAVVPQLFASCRARLRRKNVSAGIELARYSHKSHGK